MTQRMKTALCALVLALALMAAYVQERTWTGEMTPGREMVQPPVAVLPIS